MSLYLFFLGTIIFCVLQFAYGNLICLLVFLVPLLWFPLVVDKSVLKSRYVYFASFLFWLVSISWISAPHPVAIVGLLVLSGYLSFYWLLFFVSARAAVQFWRLPAMIAMPLCWVGCEFLRNNLLGGFSFCSVEHLLFSFPILIQISDIGGGYFTGGMIMSVGAGIGTILFIPKPVWAVGFALEQTLRDATLAVFSFPILKRLQHTSVLSKYCPNSIFRNNEIDNNVTKNILNDREYKSSCSSLTNSKNRSRIFVALIFTFLIIAGTVFYGYLTIVIKQNPLENKVATNSRDESQLKIASLQGNSPVSITMTNQQLNDCLNQYIELTRAAAEKATDLDLIIWSETVCPIPYIIFQNGANYENQNLDKEIFERWRSILLNLSAEVGSPILYGISTMVIDNNRNEKSAIEPLRLNSALLVVPKPLGFNSRYDKIRLVMFGEYVPFANYLPANFPLRSICQEAGRGEKPVAMKVGKDVYASVNICFESSVPHHIRGQILSLKKQKTEPALLINISNNGWFGFANQIDQHLATHVFRAVENRRLYVSSANCGYSAIINCYGEITKMGKRKSVEPVIDQLSIKYWSPLYHYVGDIPAILCTILTIFFATYTTLKKNKIK